MSAICPSGPRSQCVWLVARLNLPEGPSTFEGIIHHSFMGTVRDIYASCHVHVCLVSLVFTAYFKEEFRGAGGSRGGSRGGGEPGGGGSRGGGGVSQASSAKPQISPLAWVNFCQHSILLFGTTMEDLEGNLPTPLFASLNSPFWWNTWPCSCLIPRFALHTACQGCFIFLSRNRAQQHMVFLNPAC